MKHRLLNILVLLALLLLPATPASAQTYSFQLVEETVHLYWQEDGTLDIDYEFVFSNDSFADPIDYVDVGLPNGNYSLGNINASVDGHPISDIEESPYVTYGPALGLGANSIQPGSTGTVTMSVTGIQDVLYTDNQDDSYASAVFSPTYFDSEFVSGSTDLTVVYHLPPSVTPAEPRWHPAPDGFPEQPETAIDDQGRITYTWRNQNARGDSFYLFGASFPSSYVPANTIEEPTFTERYGINIDFEQIFGFLVFGCFCLFFVGIIFLSARAQSQRRLKYLPPKISIAGHGIKRGLTPPEAGILMEQPMDKILTMILFSVVKKGAATVTQRDPLELEIPQELPDDLREYETLFVEAFNGKSKTARRKDLQKMMVALVKSVANKMKGFSKRETVAYYEKIMKQAWDQVKSADTPDVQVEAVDKNLEWTMLDDDYDRRSREVFTGPVYVPMWWGRYDPGLGRAGTGGASVGGGSKGGGSVPSMSTGGAGLPSLPGGDFAASVVGGVQNMAAGVVGSLSDFTGGVTKVTNPPPPPSRSSGGGWSGGGSSCACACAGCACACAGGGR